MKSPVAASFRLLLRDWRGGELGVLFSALLLAVTVVVAISGFVNRLQFNLERESASFLAADLVVSSAQPVPLEWRTKVDTEGLQQGETVTFSSMVISDFSKLFHRESFGLISGKTSKTAEYEIGFVASSFSMLMAGEDAGLIFCS